MYRNLRTLILIGVDVIIIQVAFIASFLIRFDGVISLGYYSVYIRYAIAITIIKLIVFQIFKLYNSLWRFASINELMKIFVSSIVSNAIVLSFFYMIGIPLPRSIFIICTILDMMLLGGVRIGYRVLYNIKKRGPNTIFNKDYKRVMIIGAGDAGALVVKEMQQHDNLMRKPIALIDDNPMKKGQTIYHVPIVGGQDDIVSKAEKLKIDEIIIAIPSASQSRIREIVKICEKTKAKLKIVPGIYEMIGKNFEYKAIRDVQIEDLLGRDVVELNIPNICDYICNKTIFITGGGGSIGSELARQVATYSPNELILIDIYENNLYDIQNELIKKYPDKPFKLISIIASIRDRKRMDQLFNKYQPDIVFHAAAHKHVPLMEANPTEAIKNNIFGTLNIAELADIYNVKKFVLLSTDKAVNPTNIMGATKRVAEMIVQAMNKNSDTEYVAVRFGNVLGSNGSVIPLFKKQIEEGGPVTVTHPNIIRYFMTIPEAVQLVIQAGAIANGGEIFVLDMGEPVKIVDLARDLIRLSGFEPDVDISIQFTGLRPGEKLYEELLMAEEGLIGTKHRKIFIGKPGLIDIEGLRRDLDVLKLQINNEETESLISIMMEIVPTYKKAEVEELRSSVSVS